MAVGDYIEEHLRSALELLELADLEAVRAKQQLGRVIGEDFQVGAAILLIPSIFWVEGIRYRAMVTPEQAAAIREASGGSTQDVTTVVENMLNMGLYTGALLAIQIMVAALTNQPLPAAGGPAMGQAGVPSALGTINPIGACLFATGCSEPYGATLCESQGGTPVSSCSLVGRVTTPQGGHARAGENAEDGPVHARGESSGV